MPINADRYIVYDHRHQIPTSDSARRIVMNLTVSLNRSLNNLHLEIKMNSSSPYRKQVLSMVYTHIIYPQPPPDWRANAMQNINVYRSTIEP
jgi:hypothetical protein